MYDDMTPENPPDIESAVVMSRLHHPCVECGHTVEPGDRYERIIMREDGAEFTYRTCLECAAWRHEFWKKNEEHPPFGELRAWLMQHGEALAEFDGGA